MEIKEFVRIVGLRLVRWVDEFDPFDDRLPFLVAARRVQVNAFRIRILNDDRVTARLAGLSLA